MYGLSLRYTCIVSQAAFVSGSKRTHVKERYEVGDFSPHDSYSCVMRNSTARLVAPGQNWDTLSRPSIGRKLLLSRSCMILLHNKSSDSWSILQKQKEALLLQRRLLNAVSEETQLKFSNLTMREDHLMSVLDPQQSGQHKAADISMTDFDQQTTGMFSQIRNGWVMMYTSNFDAAPLCRLFVHLWKFNCASFSQHASHCNALACSESKCFCFGLPSSSAFPLVKLLALYPLCNSIITDYMPWNG